MTASITLRSHLTGSLNDLVESANLGWHGKCSVVCELVSLFADYQEEGTSLFLDVFYTDGIQDLIQSIPQNSVVRLGTCACDEVGVRKAVKKAAPLVRGCWKMYFSPGSTEELEFGLFRDSGHPLNVRIDFALQVGNAGTGRFVRVTKLGQDSVRVSTHDGKDLVVHFTNAKSTVADASQIIETLSELVCSDLEEKLSQTSKGYLASLFSTALRESHGSLVVVLRSTKIPSYLRDCTELNPPLDIGKAINEVRRDASAIPQLEAIDNLVCGMFQVDGIVIVDTTARVLAYNAFIKLKATSVSGGARRRAFEGLSGKLGKRVVGTLFSSHDGAIAFRRANE